MNVRTLTVSLLALIGIGAVDAAFAAQSTPPPMAKAESVGMSSQRLIRMGSFFSAKLTGRRCREPWSR